MNILEKKWEIKDRVYRLTRLSSPWVKIQSISKKRKPLLWFDENYKNENGSKGANREIRYAVNQKSLFIDEQDGFANLADSHVVFQDGMLRVGRNDILLQKLLSIYHPDLGKKWVEVDYETKAKDDLEYAEIELKAWNMANEMEEEHMISILRTEYGSEVSDYKPNQLKRLGIMFARNNPELFIELAEDEDVQLRNLANLAVEMGYVELTDNNTTFKWKKNGKKIFTVPFDQHPYQAFAQFFKTDEGASVLTSLEKKMK